MVLCGIMSHKYLEFLHHSRSTAVSQHEAQTEQKLCWSARLYNSAIELRAERILQCECKNEVVQLKPNKDDKEKIRVYNFPFPFKK